MYLHELQVYLKSSYHFCAHCCRFYVLCCLQPSQFLPHPDFHLAIWKSRSTRFAWLCCTAQMRVCSCHAGHTITTVPLWRRRRSTKPWRRIPLPVWCSCSTAVPATRCHRSTTSTGSRFGELTRHFWPRVHRLCTCWRLSALRASILRLDGHCAGGRGHMQVGVRSSACSLCFRSLLLCSYLRCSSPRLHACRLTSAHAWC